MQKGGMALAPKGGLLRFPRGWQDAKNVGIGSLTSAPSSSLGKEQISTDAALDQSFLQGGSCALLFPRVLLWARLLSTYQEGSK